MSSPLPEKNFFRIGEVSKITGLKPYVLRYWETEFKKIRPLKTRSHQRVYQRKDVELILEIKHLLYDKKFTIAGAKKILQQAEKPKKATKKFDAKTLQTLKEELTIIKDILE